MTVEELIKQAAKEILVEQMADTTEPQEEVVVQESSAEQLTSTAKSGC